MILLTKIQLKFNVSHLNVLMKSSARMRSSDQSSEEDTKSYKQILVMTSVEYERIFMSKIAMLLKFITHVKAVKKQLCIRQPQTKSDLKSKCE